MANPTTNYGFVLPTPTDLVTDLPADFDVALQGVDTRLKALQPGTTLGDLFYASATANTNTRLGVGTNGQVLSVSGGVPAWTTAASGGKLIQMVQATYATQTTSSSATFADTGLTATITPTLATSKVLVQVHLPIYRDATSSGTAVGLKLLRGATDIGGTQTNYLLTATALKQQSMWSFAYLDSPATTSATTYKMQFACITGAGIVAYCIDNNLATMILTEVGA